MKKVLLIAALAFLVVSTVSTVWASEKKVSTKRGFSAASVTQKVHDTGAAPVPVGVAPTSTAKRKKVARKPKKAAVKKQLSFDDWFSLWRTKFKECKSNVDWALLVTDLKKESFEKYTQDFQNKRWLHSLLFKKIQKEMSGDWSSYDHDTGTWVLSPGVYRTKKWLIDGVFVSAYNELALIRNNVD